MLTGCEEELSPSVVAYIAVQGYNTIAMLLTKSREKRRIDLEIEGTQVNTWR